MTRTGGSQVKLDFGIYTMHWAFWGAFGLTRVILRRRDHNDSRPAATAPISQQETTAPFSRALLAFHGLAFAVMYLGISIAVIPGRVPNWFPGQRIAGSLVIARAAARVVSAIASFRSWRLRWTVAERHQLRKGRRCGILRRPPSIQLRLLDV